MASMLQARFFAAQQRQQAGHIEWLDDGQMHVILVGTGCPVHDPTRSAPCTAVIAGGEFLIIDTGPGSWHAIREAGLPHRDLTGVLMTHYHSDHIGDMGEVMTQHWVNHGPANKGLPVYGPPGIHNIVKAFHDAYEPDSHYREDHHTPEHMPRATQLLKPVEVRVPEADGDYGEASALWQQEVDVPLGDAAKEGGLKVTAFHVDHRPVVPAYGYKFEYRGRTCVVSGDTCKCPSVAHQARGCDLLVHEACACKLIKQASDMSVAAGDIRRGQLGLDITDYHTSPEQCIELARDANVTHLAFTHIVPPMRNPVVKMMWTEGLSAKAKGWSGGYTIGEDGMHFQLPTVAGSKAVLRADSDNCSFTPGPVKLFRGAVLVTLLYWLQPGRKPDGRRYVAALMLAAVAGRRSAQL